MSRINKIKLTKLLTILLILVKLIPAIAQLKTAFTYPEVGTLCPDFTASNIEYFPKNKVELKDFKGKWLILDFWNRRCGVCIASFPKLNEMQKDLKEDVQFLLIAYNGSKYSHQPDDKIIRSLYEKLRLKYKLELAVAFDSTLFTQFDIGPCPYIVIVDDRGIVRGITTHIESQKLKDLLAGLNPPLARAYRSHEENSSEASYNPSLPFATFSNGTADTNFIYRSLLSKWSESMASTSPTSINESYNHGRFELLKTDIASLYAYAYFGRPFWNYGDSMYGRYWETPILEASDTTPFLFDSVTGKNLYCYSLIVPPNKATYEHMQSVMKGDLRNYFGYKVDVEVRNMPYWSLTVREEFKGKLQTKGRPTTFNATPYSGIEGENIQIGRLLSFIAIYNQMEPPFVDETGIDSNIDITLNSMATDLPEIKQELNRNGLLLLKKERPMKVIVIRD